MKQIYTQTLLVVMIALIGKTPELYAGDPPKSDLKSKAALQLDLVSEFSPQRTLTSYESAKAGLDQLHKELTEGLGNKGPVSYYATFLTCLNELHTFDVYIENSDVHQYGVTDLGRLKTIRKKIFDKIIVALLKLTSLSPSYKPSYYSYKIKMEETKDFRTFFSKNVVERSEYTSEQTIAAGIAGLRYANLVDVDLLIQLRQIELTFPGSKIIQTAIEEVKRARFSQGESPLVKKTTRGQKTDPEMDIHKILSGYLNSYLDNYLSNGQKSGQSIAAITAMLSNQLEVETKHVHAAFATLTDQRQFEFPLDRNKRKVNMIEFIYLSFLIRPELVESLDVAVKDKMTRFFGNILYPQNDHDYFSYDSGMVKAVFEALLRNDFLLFKQIDKLCGKIFSPYGL